jgi:beta-lactamase regulating signal transducer with metallopeptidase domain
MYMSGNIIVDSLVSFRDVLLTASPAVSRTAGAILVTAVWQGAVVAACLAICLKLTKRVSPALRFTIWTAGFLVIAALPLLPLLLHLASGSSGIGFGLANRTSRAWLQFDVRWSIALTVLWAMASLYRAVDLTIHSVRLRRLWTTAIPVELNTIEDGTFALPAKLWGRRRIQICTTNALDRPSVIGFLAPRILIPEWLFSQLTPGELDQIVLHETEHLRRGDDWTNLLQKLSLVLFPLNPVLLWIERQLCLEREMACDEAVIRVTRAPRAYAACLASLAERRLHQRVESASLGALSLGAWQRRPELVRRVHSILLRKQVLGPLGTRSLLAVLGCGLVFGSVELSRCPQLIAFTETSPAETAQLHTPQLTQPAHFPVLNAAFTGSEQNLSSHASLSGRPYLTELKATMPVRTGSSLAMPCAYKRVHANSAVRRPSKERSPQILDRNTPRQELLRAEAANSASAAASQSGWVVLTTWEEVEVSNTGLAQAYDDTSEANEPSSHPTAAQRVDQQPARMTMTRLILRVLPADSAPSSSPTAVRIRNGWLVIQL